MHFVEAFLVQFATPFVKRCDNQFVADAAAPVQDPSGSGFFEYLEIYYSAYLVLLFDSYFVVCIITLLFVYLVPFSS